MSQNETNDVVVSFSNPSKPTLVTLNDKEKRDAHFSGIRQINDKTVADCVESLIGASLVVRTVADKLLPRSIFSGRFTTP